jgi:hypothetical protein
MLEDLQEVLVGRQRDGTVAASANCPQMVLIRLIARPSELAVNYGTHPTVAGLLQGHPSILNMRRAEAEGPFLALLRSRKEVLKGHTIYFGCKLRPKTLALPVHVAR